MYRLPYGHGSLDVPVSANWRVEEIVPHPPLPLADPLGSACHALAHLVGMPPLRRLSGATTVAIAINDKTRPAPHHLLLPPLIDWLGHSGVAPAAIRFIVATGLHRPMASEEYDAILPPELLAHSAIVCHDARNESELLWVGKTGEGTPVWCNRHFMESDVRIVVGVVEPHQFMGFSGGAKSAAIGLCGSETIGINHSKMLHPNARLARYDDNPARREVEEIGRMLDISLALNAVMDDERRIVALYAGEPEAVMRAAIPVALGCHSVSSSGGFDLVIASPGGHPKDINLYQAQKALTSAALLAAPGAPIIVAAHCPEGSGSDAYERWMADKHSHSEVIERFASEPFRIGPHKAFQIARAAVGREVILVSSIEQSLATRLLLRRASDITEAVASLDLSTCQRVALLPHANTTVPIA